MISIFLISDILFNYFFSSLFTLSYIILIAYFTKYRFKKYIWIVIVIGLIYDLILTDILFLNSLLFLTVLLLVRKYRKYNIFILGLLTIIFYYSIISLFISNSFLSINYFLNYICINYVIFLNTYFIYKRIYNTR